MKSQKLVGLLSLFVLVGAVLASLFARESCAQGVCENPPGQGTTTVWPQNATINVGISAAFSKDQKDAIGNQLFKWRKAGNLNITFNIKKPGELGGGAVGGGKPILFIFKATPSPSNMQGSTGGNSYNGRRGDSTVNINPGVTDPTAFLQVVSHEMGHTFGLDDCTGCAQNSSAMTLGTSGMNSTGGHDGPTTCDSCEVYNNYNSIAHGTACASPSPTPTPSAGYCHGNEDWTAFTGTGCAAGFTNFMGVCDRDVGYQSSCAEPGGYDPDSCSCPDGFSQAPGGCNAASDYGTYSSTGCSTGFVDHSGTCEKSFSFQSTCADPAGYEPESCSCPDGINPSPIIIDVDHSGFSLTSAVNGVPFDILSMGTPLHLAWVAPGSTNAFLALDRNGNGTIDNGEELFGNLSPQPELPDPNGFKALALFDQPANGGNMDGVISRKDSIFRELKLWQDVNHNGISESSELHTLAELGLRKMELDYQESRRVDQYGNRFRYRAKVRDAQDAQLGRWAWDVFLTTTSP